MTTLTLNQQITFMESEYSRMRKYLPETVAAGRMTPEVMASKIAHHQAVMATLQTLNNLRYGVTHG